MTRAGRRLTLLLLRVVMLADWVRAEGWYWAESRSCAGDSDS